MMWLFKGMLDMAQPQVMTHRAIESPDFLWELGKSSQTQFILTACPEFRGKITTWDTALENRARNGTKI